MCLWGIRRAAEGGGGGGGFRSGHFCGGRSIDGWSGLGVCIIEGKIGVIIWCGNWVLGGCVCVFGVMGLRWVGGGMGGRNGGMDLGFGEG